MKKRIPILSLTLAVCGGVWCFAQGNAMEKTYDKSAETVWKGGVTTAAWIFTDRSKAGQSVTQNSGNGKAGELVEKGGAATAGTEPSLRMPLELVPGYTMFLTDCEDESTKIVTPVSCGVFGVSTDGVAYTLYTIDGKMMGGKNEWRVADFTRIPQMAPEGLIMQKNGADRQLYLIKPTGAIERLPKKYVSATNFVDGIAAVGESTPGFNLRWTLVDRNLRPYAPGVLTQPRQFGQKQFTIAPLKEGRRAVYVLPDENAFTGKWGYMNALGKMVIQPQYQEARSYCDSLALVVEEGGDDFYFIDMSGRKKFEPKKVSGEIVDPASVSDYDKGVCTIAPMTVDDTVDGQFARYFSTDGRLVGYALWGTATHHGNGYMRYIDEESGEEVPTNLVIQSDLAHYLIHKGHKIKEDPHTAEWGTPWYDDGDVAHYSDGATSVVGVGSVYCYPWKIGAFSADGYAPAEILSPNGEVTYEGLIDRQGKFRIIYQVR